MRTSLILVTLAVWFAFGALTVRTLDQMDRDYAAETRI